MRTFIKSLLPPMVVTTIRRLIPSQYGWKGTYTSWEEALEDASGYDDNLILQQVENSLLKVKTGEAVAERDGTLFEEVPYSWQSLAGLLYAAAKSKGRIHVLDFGGSLGSSYYQNKKFLDGLSDVSWSIVEQPHFVKSGLKNFANERLKFFDSIDSCLVEETPNILLLSSVIQYIADYQDLLHKLLSYPFDVVIIDRTPFSLSKQDEIKLQIVPSHIYKASYPSWFISQPILENIFQQNNYELLESFITQEGIRDGAVFKGMIWIQKDAVS